MPSASIRVFSASRSSVDGAGSRSAKGVANFSSFVWSSLDGSGVVFRVICRPFGTGLGLEYAADPNGMDKQLYYVDPDLRPLIASELKPYRIFVIYSTLIKDFVLWYIKVTIGNSWYDSQLSMFNRPHEYFATHEINVRPDRPATQYRIRSHEIRATELEWPTTDTGILLGEALQENFINSAEHEMYRELTDGEVL